MGLSPAERWFSPTAIKATSAPAVATSGLLGLLLLGRLLGRRFPRPEHVPLDQAKVVARWVAEALDRAGAALLRTGIGASLEVVKAARRDKLDLAGATFWVSGEPLTEARASQIASVGVRVAVGYGTSELNGVADSCAFPICPDDMHLRKDLVALVRYQREHNGVGVEPFLFTSLHSLAPKVLVNVETDDCGEVEERSCGCFFEEVGLTTHVHHIRSFSKVTTLGRNVLGSDFVRILEEVLPARFGGSPVDYQLLEEEGEDGTIRLTLLINPDVGEVDDAQVVDVVMAQLREGRPAYRVTAELWQQTGTISVQRRRPIATWRGKVLPLHFTSQRLAEEEDIKRHDGPARGA